jgi:hypothetical protein
MTAEMENFVTASNMAPSLSVEQTAWIHTLRWVPAELEGVLASLSDNEAQENGGVSFGDEVLEILFCSIMSL